MLKTLVVEDEIRQRRVLVSILRELRPEYEVYEASNGEEALDLICKFDLDIIFTDIRMPKMDGFELVARLVGKKKIRVIIISAYGTFEYAKKALGQGVLDFLLKPFDNEAIENVLMKVEKDIEEEKHEIVEKNHLITTIDSSLPVYVNYIMNNWIRGIATEKELVKIREIVKGKGKGLSIVIEIHEDPVTMQNEYLQLDRETKITLMRVIEEEYSKYGEVTSLILDQKDDLIAHIVAVNGDMDLVRKGMLQCSYELVSKIKACYAIDIFIGLSGNCDDIFNDIRETLKAAEKALALKYCIDCGNVFDYSLLDKQKQSMPLKTLRGLPEKEKLLNEAVMSLNIPEAARLFEEILAEIAGLCYSKPEYLPERTGEAFVKLLANLRETIGNEEAIKLTNQIKEEFRPDECWSNKKIREKGSKTIEDIVRTIEDRRNNANVILIKDCINYMNKHFSEKITMESVAHLFHFNPSYFSVFFKKCTGKNFMDYLTAIRINTAKELLTNTDKKIYEIANGVGYGDEKYFTKIFRKYIGLTPGEFRKTNMNFGSVANDRFDRRGKKPIL